MKRARKMVGPLLLVAMLAAAMFAARAGQATGENTIATPDTSAGQSVLMLDDVGNPIVVYHSFGGKADAVKVLRCGNSDCMVDNVVSTPDLDGGGFFLSATLDASGNPVVSYSTWPDEELRLLRCSEPACTAGNTISTLDMEYPVRGTSLALDGLGNPIILYMTDELINMRILHCADIMCTTVNANTPIDHATLGDLVLNEAGNPVVAYLEGGVNLKLLTCGNPACTASNAFTTLDTEAHSGGMALALDGLGRPVVAYTSNADAPNKLRVVNCGNAMCTSGNTFASPDMTSQCCGPLSLVLDGEGNPVVAYGDSSLASPRLKVLHCGTSTCTAGNVISTPDEESRGHEGGSLALDDFGNPVISYRDDATTDLKVLHCSNPACASSEKATPTPSPTNASSPVPTETPGPTETPDAGATATATASVTRTPTWTPSPSASPTPLVSPGDVTCNGTIDPIDALFILQFDAGLVAGLPCAGVADVNGDGRADPIDASLILQFAAGLIAELPP